MYLFIIETVSIPNKYAGKYNIFHIYSTNVEQFNYLEDEEKSQDCAYLHYLFDSMQCILCTVFNDMHCILDIISCALYPMHCILFYLISSILSYAFICIILYVLHYMHWIHWIHCRF